MSGAPYTLTRLDCAAMAKSDRIEFNTETQPDGLVVSFLRCWKKVERTTADPFAPEERAHYIDAGFTVIDYTADQSCFGRAITGRPDDHAAVKATHHETTSYDTIQALLYVVQPGDRLHMLWGAGAGTSPFLREKGVRVDTLHIRVRKGLGDKERTITLHIETRAGASSGGWPLVRLREQPAGRRAGAEVAA